MIRHGSSTPTYEPSQLKQGETNQTETVAELEGVFGKVFCIYRSMERNQKKTTSTAKNDVVFAKILLDRFVNSNYSNTASISMSHSRVLSPIAFIEITLCVHLSCNLAYMSNERPGRDPIMSLTAPLSYMSSERPGRDPIMSLTAPLSYMGCERPGRDPIMSLTAPPLIHEQ